MAYRIVAKFGEQTLRMTLAEGRTEIGSDPTCGICLPNSTVSRRHAAVSHGPRGFELEDLGSLNGTLLRSRRVERATLEPGDIFVIGRVVLLIEEVADEDLEAGIVLPMSALPEADGRGLVPGGQTEICGLLDRFSLEFLPRLLEELHSGASLQRLAQQVGYSLFEALPVLAVEVIETWKGERGVVYAAEREGCESSEWVEAIAGPCRVRALFESPSNGRHYRPLVDSVALLLSLVGRLQQPIDETELPAPTLLVGKRAQRPQPDSVVPELQTLYDQAERVARGDVGVLISGESGTGKEVLARFIHSSSPRAAQPMVAINCASLPRDLLEAELFGVEKGVATGVEARPGKFELADGGTIFLDEIGDMSAETQAKILRALQEKEVFRLGGSRPRPARARVIGATNRPIQRMLADGTFRSDLYHRVATWEVELPPLRRRRADIPNLAALFLAREAQRCCVRIHGISRAALRELCQYRWPGNIRQLKNEIARAVLFLEDGELLDTSRLGPSVRAGLLAGTGGALQRTLEIVERDEIIAALELCRGDTAAAAERLEISRPTLYRRIKSLAIINSRAAS